MKILVVLLACLTAIAQEYTLGPNSQRTIRNSAGQGDAAHLDEQDLSWHGSRLLGLCSGAYDVSKPACVMIFQDGGGMVTERGAWHGPIVMDNLIHKREMPVTIGIFINPGVLPALPKNSRAGTTGATNTTLWAIAMRGFCRRDSAGGWEGFEAVGRPEDRPWMGSSSGGIAAFTAAWNRPDAFHRVISFIGSYTNLRGAQELFVADPQDGAEASSGVPAGRRRTRTSTPVTGGWRIRTWPPRLSMPDMTQRLWLEPRGTTRHGSAILPDAMRWLWRDYPKPITTAERVSERHEVRLILDPAHGWELVGEGYKLTTDSAHGCRGAIEFSPIPRITGSIRLGRGRQGTRL